MSENLRELQAEIERRLPNWLIFEIQETSSGCVVLAQFALPPKFCSVCELINPRLTKAGTRQLFIRDLPIQGQWVVVQCTQQRYQCQNCSSRFWELLGGVNDRRRMTVNLIEYIEQTSKTEQLDNLATEIGLDEKLSRKLRQYRTSVRNMEDEDDLFVY